MATVPVDVLIIGSGHAGGMAAKILTEKGISCVMLNAGPVADVARHAQHKSAYELPFRGFKPPARLEHVFQSSGYNANVWVDEEEVPYTVRPCATVQLGSRAPLRRPVPVLVATVVSPQ